MDYSANKQIWKRDLLVDFSANWQIWNEKRIDWLLYLKPTLFITVFVIQQRLNLSQKCLILKPKFLSRINCSKCHWSCRTCSTDSFNSCVYLQKAAFMCKKHINVNCAMLDVTYCIKLELYGDLLHRHYLYIGDSGFCAIQHSKLQFKLFKTRNYDLFSGNNHVYIQKSLLCSRLVFSYTTCI